MEGQRSFEGLWRWSEGPQGQRDPSSELAPKISQGVGLELTIKVSGLARQKIEHVKFFLTDLNKILIIRDDSLAFNSSTSVKSIANRLISFKLPLKLG